MSGRDYKRALYALAAQNLVRLHERPEEVLAVARPSGEDWLRFHLPTGHWKAMPSGLRGKGLYAAARYLGLGLQEIADAFSA